MDESEDIFVLEPELKRAKRGEVRACSDCPYLDTVNRSLLDFDFEKQCSESLATMNVYACLVCGKYFAGRSQGTPAYFHSLECCHYVFMNLHSGRFFCIPENYEIIDPSLQDIRYYWDPTFTSEAIEKLDTTVKKCRGVDGEEFIPGTIGMNTLRDADYINVVIQALSKVTPLRSFFLVPQNYKELCGSGAATILVERFGELLRKIWNPRNFRGHVSPHELVQAVSDASEKKFRIGSKQDGLDFLRWLLNVMSAALRVGDPISVARGSVQLSTEDHAQTSSSSSLPSAKRHSKSTIIENCFQGRVKMTSYRMRVTGVESKGVKPGVGGEASTSQSGDESLLSTIFGEEQKMIPFLILTLDLPRAPLFRESSEKNFIPQVPLYQLLTKFDGVKEIDTPVAAGTVEKRRYIITRLPKYLIFHINRFSKNDYTIEKNPSIVNFPVKNLDMSPYFEPASSKDQTSHTKYNLIACICHEGKSPFEGIYRVYVINKAQDKWYFIDGLEVQEVLPQQVSLSEAYIQIFEQQR